MRLSTSTNLFGYKRGKKEYTPTIECLHRSYDVGFRVMDMNFCPLIQGLSEAAGDDWEQQIYAIRNEADRLGIEFSQSHLPIYPDFMPVPLANKPDSLQNFAEITRRAVVGSGILGVKWAVAHLFANYKEDLNNPAADVKLNYEFYAPIFEQCKKAGIGIAFENLAGPREGLLKRKFSSTAEDLLKMVEAFHDESVGTCWDFGHGHRFYKDSARPLRLLGKHLKATHVDDNKSVVDSHMAPFIAGDLNWERLMPVLTEIGYEGDFTFEIHGMTDDLPDELRDECARICYKLGMYCIELAQA